MTTGAKRIALLLGISVTLFACEKKAKSGNAQAGPVVGATVVPGTTAIPDTAPGAVPGPGVVPVPGASASEIAQPLASLSDRSLDSFIESLLRLLSPNTERGRLQADLFFCAADALWSALPIGKVGAGGKTALKFFVLQHARGRGVRLGEASDALEALRRLAVGEPGSLKERVTTAYAVLQVLNHAMGGSRPTSVAIDLASTFTNCGIAIIGGADQLIQDINSINREFSTREIWDASNDALGVAGPPVFVVIVGGNLVTRVGASAGEALSSLLFQDLSNPSPGVQRQTPAPGSLAAINQCCYCYRDLYEHYRFTPDKLIRRDNWWYPTLNDGGAHCGQTPERNPYGQVPNIQSNGYPVYVHLNDCGVFEVLGNCRTPPLDWPHQGTRFTIQYRRLGGNPAWTLSTSP